MNDEQETNHAFARSRSNAGLELSRPSTWPRKLQIFAIEARRNPRLHKARARRLVDAGIAVMLHNDEYCVLKLSAHDAIGKMLSSNV
jgi:hypothetical protein